MAEADAAAPRSLSRRQALSAGALVSGGAALAALSRPSESSASTITGWFNVMDPPYGATGDGTTDDTTAIQDAIDDAASDGGVVYFPPGTYRLSGSPAFLYAPGGVRLVGAGRDATILKGPEGFDNTAYIVEAISGHVELADLRLEMPDSFVNDQGTYIRGVQLGDQAESVLARNVYFHNLTYGIVGWGGMTQRIEASECLFTAEDVSVDFDAFGILYNGAPGAEVVVRGCEFRKLGSRNTSPNQLHCLYLSDTTALLCTGSRFYEHEDGRYIQWYGDDYVNQGSALYAIVANCYFGPQATPNTGIHTCPTVDTIVNSCHFSTQRRSITIRGNCLVANCIFNGQDGGGYWQIDHADTLGNDAIVVFDGCTFRCHNLVDINIDGDKNIDLAIRDCSFDGDSLQHVLVTGSAGTKHVSVQGCRFEGPNTDWGAMTIERASRVEISGNSFRNEGDAIEVASGAGVSRMVVGDNEFSQSGDSITFNSTPATFNAFDNHGTTGYRSRNGGTASVANGGTIAHGLGSTGAPITPSRYSVTPTVARRVAAVTAVNATSLTVALHNDAGTAITTAMNVGWWAEQ